MSVKKGYSAINCISLILIANPMFLTQRFGGHSHSYNGFSKWLFFGGDGVISKNDIGGVICKTRYVSVLLSKR